MGYGTRAAHNLMLPARVFIIFIYFVIVPLIANAVVSSSVNVDVTITGTSSGAISEMLIGAWGPGFYNMSGWLGRSPDFNANYTGSGSYECSQNSPWPITTYMSTLDSGSPWGTYMDGFAAANGDYNSIYAQIVQDYSSCVDRLYYVKINNEWESGLFASSPFYTSQDQNNPDSGRDPATWVAGIRQLISIIRSNPAWDNVRISLDYTGNDSLKEPYWPGDDVMDLVSLDVYQDYRYLGSDSVVAWESRLNNGPGIQGPNFTTLEGLDAFAKKHGKPIVIPEWGDTYCDGYNITQFADWMASHNVKAHDYWDFPNWDVSIELTECQGRQDAYYNAFHNPYSGTYWPVHYPTP